MNETTQQQGDRGSGSGQADHAYREFLQHATTCTDSCRAGVNCAEGVDLYRTWRDLKNQAAKGAA